MGQIQGDLSVMPLADLAIWFANRESTGVLTVERGSTKKEFVLERGALARASSNDPREYFGQFLIHFGLLTEDQLERAFETQRETKVFLGRILVMIGIVPEEKIVQALSVKISESLLDAFRWSAGRFQFVDQSNNEARPEVEVSVGLVDLHREGLRRNALWEQFKHVFPSQRAQLAVAELRVPPGLGMDTLDGRIIALARHGLTIESIALELHATDYQCAARLYELHRLGIIEPREPVLLPSRSDVTLPPGVLTHADLAIDAMAANDFTRAFKHAQASVNSDPGNAELTHLSEQIEGKFREHLSEVVARDTTPAVLRELDDTEQKMLTPKQRYILGRIDGRRSVHAIIQVSPMRDVEAMDIMRFLKRQGIIRL
jgi:hypothetical protein